MASIAFDGSLKSAVEATNYCSLGQLILTMFEVGGIIGGTCRHAPLCEHPVDPPAIRVLRGPMVCNVLK